MRDRDEPARVLVFAPTHRNAEIIAQRLRGGGLECLVPEDVAAFERTLFDEGESLSAVVLTEAARRVGVGPIIDRFQRQEPGWSSLPLILLAPPDDTAVPPWPHTTVVSQPTTARQLVSVLGLAIEVRAQQRRLARANLRLERMAYQDSLTGLPNRVALYERIRELQRERRGGQSTFSAVFIDLDDFKSMNDRYGHEAGDEALRQVGLHLSTAVRSTDFVARWGGDEFIVLLVGGDDAEHDDLTVRRLSTTVTLRLEGLSAPIGLSLSVGRIDDIHAEQSVDEILSIADSRMYEHKYRKQGRRTGGGGE
jgi:diguanylate cyclase (GGDEF)-like protein